MERLSLFILENYRIMIPAASSPSSASTALFGWPGVRVVLIASLIVSLFWLPIFQAPWALLMFRIARRLG
jgi:hypothetical protein